MPVLNYHFSHQLHNQTNSPIQLKQDKNPKTKKSTAKTTNSMKKTKNSTMKSKMLKTKKTMKKSKKKMNMKKSKKKQTNNNLKQIFQLSKLLTLNNRNSNNNNKGNKISSHKSILKKPFKQPNHHMHLSQTITQKSSISHNPIHFIFTFFDLFKVSRILVKCLVNHSKSTEIHRDLFQTEYRFQKTKSIINLTCEIQSTKAKSEF